MNAGNFFRAPCKMAKRKKAVRMPVHHLRQPYLNVQKQMENIDAQQRFLAAQHAMNNRIQLDRFKAHGLSRHI